MLRQYNAQTARGGDNPLRVGTIPIGAIFYIQNEDWWRDRYRGRPICRNPWIVEGFIPDTMGAGRRDPDTGRWISIRVARSDIAIVRSLRDGRRTRVLIRVLQAHEEEGLAVECGYPTLPDLRHYKRGALLAQPASAPRRMRRAA
jgi:hypothetical protein